MLSYISKVTTVTRDYIFGRLNKYAVFTIQLFLFDTVLLHKIQKESKETTSKS